MFVRSFVLALPVWCLRRDYLISPVPSLNSHNPEAVTRKEKKKGAQQSKVVFPQAYNTPAATLISTPLPQVSRSKFQVFPLASAISFNFVPILTTLKLIIRGSNRSVRWIKCCVGEFESNLMMKYWPWVWYTICARRRVGNMSFSQYVYPRTTPPFFSTVMPADLAISLISLMEVVRTCVWWLFIRDGWKGELGMIYHCDEFV